MQALVLSMIVVLGHAKSTLYFPSFDVQLKASHSLVRATVIDKKGEDILLLRNDRKLAGASVEPVFRVSGYSLYEQFHSSTIPKSLKLEKGKTYYLLLRWAPKHRSWKLGSPDKVCALVTTEGVVGGLGYEGLRTITPVDDYEALMTGIFQFSHGLPVNVKRMRKFIEYWLKRPPGRRPENWRKHQASSFYFQRIALKLLGRFPRDGDFQLIKPFYVLTDFQGDTIGRLKTIPGRKVDDFLLETILTAQYGSDAWSALHLLSERGARYTRPALEKWLAETRVEELDVSGFQLTEKEIAEERALHLKVETEFREKMRGLCERWRKEAK